MKFFINLKALKCAFACGLICAISFSLAGFDASCEQLRQNVLRLHIIANSDSAEDQALKLEIRDKLLDLSPELFSESSDIESAIVAAKTKTDDIKALAEEVVSEYGYDYDVEVLVGKSYFNTREYEDFTLPAGEYDSLIIRLGKAAGKNWWCVIYPELCLPAAADKAELSSVVDEESARIAEESERYIMRFKIVEIYEEIKKSLKK